MKMSRLETRSVLCSRLHCTCHYDGLAFSCGRAIMYVNLLFYVTRTLCRYRGCYVSLTFFYESFTDGILVTFLCVKSAFDTCHTLCSSTLRVFFCVRASFDPRDRKKRFPTTLPNKVHAPSEALLGYCQAVKANHCDD